MLKRLLLLCVFGNLLFANSQTFNQNSTNLNALKNTLLNAKIYENPKWLALLHYENGKSAIAKGSNFFLSQNGHKNAKDEYTATIEAFFEQMSKPNLKDLENSTLCKYPARFISSHKR